MKMCTFPGCQRFPHSAATLHAVWDAAAAIWRTLPDQRTPAERMRERRATINREKAERIAEDVLTRNGLAHWLDRDHERSALAVLADSVNADDMTAEDALTQLALAALTEKENAR